MKVFNSLHEIELDIYKNSDAILRDVLMNDVAPIVQGILTERIANDIYGAYSPSFYKRRYALLNSIESSMIDGNTLYVTSTAEPARPHLGWATKEPGAFLHLLGQKHLGFWKTGFARPALKMAQQDVINNQQINNAIAAAFSRISD